MKNVIVFGGGYIGNSILKMFQKKGYNVSCVTHEEMKDYESITSFFKLLKKDKNYIIIVTAGFLDKKPFIEMSEGDIERCIQSNFLSVVYVFQEALKNLKSPELFCISSSVYKGRKHYSIYSAQKMGLYSFIKSLREEHPGVFIGCIFPGRTATPLRWKNYGLCTEKDEDVMSPDDIAEQIFYQIQNKDENFYEIRKIKNEIILKKIEC